MKSVLFACLFNGLILVSPPARLLQLFFQNVPDVKRPLTYSVEWELLSDTFKELTLDDTYPMAIFHAKNAQPDGKQNYDDLRRALPDSLSAITGIDQLFDQDGDGFVNFRDFLWTACLLRHFCNISFDQLQGSDAKPISSASVALVKELIQDALGSKKTN
eukprot:m.226938 g.226938  ORF g.226938 m.226938 type:complete len:160 (+) comp15171_c0_seq27:118-597(+)